MNLKLACSLISISLVFFFSNLYAGNPETRLLFSISQNTIRLGVINASQQNLDLELIEKSGSAFLNKTTKGGTNYFQMFDVSNLPDGDYIVRLSGGSFSVKKKFVIENRKPKIKIEVEPKFKLVGNETLLVFYPNPQKKNIDITLEHNNEVVFEESKLKDEVLNKRYSLRSLPKGSYDLRFFVDDELYRYSFEVK